MGRKPSSKMWRRFVRHVRPKVLQGERRWLDRQVRRAKAREQGEQA